jgi:hypothetical protein
MPDWFRKLKKILLASLPSVTTRLIVSFFLGLSGFVVIAERVLRIPHDDETRSFAFFVAIVGIGINWVVLSDVAERMRAKKKLGKFLLSLPPQQIRELYDLIAVVRFPVFIRDWETFERRDHSRDYSSAWSQLLSYLTSNPQGIRASYALFQRSEIARPRYLQSAMQLASNSDPLSRLI